MKDEKRARQSATAKAAQWVNNNLDGDNEFMHETTKLLTDLLLAERDRAARLAERCDRAGLAAGYIAKLIRSGEEP